MSLPRRGLWLALLLLATACSAGSAGEAPEEAAPAASPAVTPPATFVEQSLAGLRFAAPAGWRQVPQAAQTDPDAGPLELALRAPAAEDEPAGVVLAQVVVEPRRPATEEAEALAGIKRDVHKADDVRTVPFALEGFRTALVVSYTEQGADGHPQSTDVLVGDLADGSVVTLTVKAARTDYDAEGLSAITRSARAAATAG